MHKPQAGSESMSPAFYLKLWQIYDCGPQTNQVGAKTIKKCTMSKALTFSNYKDPVWNAEPSNLSVFWFKRIPQQFGKMRIYSIQYTCTTYEQIWSMFKTTWTSDHFYSFPINVKATLSSASSTSRVVVTTAKRGCALKEVKKRTMQSRQYLGLVLKQLRRQELCQYCSSVAQIQHKFKPMLTSSELPTNRWQFGNCPCKHSYRLPRYDSFWLQGNDCGACHKAKDNQHETKTKGLFYQGDAVIARISRHILPMQRFLCDCESELSTMQRFPFVSVILWFANQYSLVLF